MDGTPTLRMTEFMLSALCHNKIDHGSDSVREGLPAPAELKFELDATTKTNIANAEKHFDELVGAHDLHVRSPPLHTSFSLSNLTVFTGPTLRRLRQERNQATQSLTRRLGSNGQTTRLPQNVQPTRRHLRKRSNT